ncbi:HDL296Wp [Eremothecium sinecaudum]|uniref:Glutamyl-tRNA(Gln) amidotransferase subunit B, mitochondrial n=1 Tax=Eremothecium sinecaudum TaxID=45286 RepID=A0A109UZ98_9SACH|nr:HDL296Wp [Eremothecium sinecaudum]AMD20448.1 HDL296Wp [Eremothecium sinecaudum]
MVTMKRLYGTTFTSPVVRLYSDYRLKCGVEIHTQLNTKNKLFSMSTNDPFYSTNKPNHHTSYFDLGLPGTQPKLNYEAVLFATKLSLALDCEINTNSQFDRKHYFYGDQPLGYQITQHYKPFSKNGKLVLSKDIDGLEEEEKTIRIQQLQLEQDTGRSLYKEAAKNTLIDLNRSNVPLIELVTSPDFTDIKQVRGFIKKYQNLVRHLGISTGDLETGAMRVDVNISVNEHPRVELKNLPNTSSIVNAIKYEYNRQINLIRHGKVGNQVVAETRSWNGKETVKSRSKETTIDYRYLPDPELPRIVLDVSLINCIKAALPELPESTLKTLMDKPFCLSIKDAKILTTNSNKQNVLYSHNEIRRYYLDTFSEFTSLKDSPEQSKLPSNWIIHELLGNLNKLDIPLSEVTKILPAKVFAQFLSLINLKKISNASGKLLLFHILQKFKDSGFKDTTPVDLNSVINEYDLGFVSNCSPEELKEVCQGILDNLKDRSIINDLVSGKKKNSIKYLVGLGMRSLQGRVDAQSLQDMFKEILGIKW